MASLCECFAETINKVGPGILEGREYPLRLLFLRFHLKLLLGLETIANIAVQVLDQKAMCQQDPDQDESEEAPEDAAEYDSVLISSAGDLVASLANALGTDFAQAFPTFFALIAKYYVRSSIVNVLPDC